MLEPPPGGEEMLGGGVPLGEQPSPSLILSWPSFLYSILFPLAFYHGQKRREPNQFPAAASVQAWFCHPAVINVCLTSKAAGGDGVKALTGRVTVICVLTFHVQSSGNRKLLQRGRKKVSTSFIYQSLYIYSILSSLQLGADLFFFSIFSFLDLLAFISSFVNQLKDFFFFFQICFFFFLHGCKALAFVDL